MIWPHPTGATAPAPRAAEDLWPAQLYAQRAALSARCAERAYFFEVDRRTNSLILPQCPDLSPGIQAHCHGICQRVLCGAMRPALKARFEGGIPRVEVSLPDLVHLASVFRAAATFLSHDSAAIVHAYRRFASGFLREEFDFASLGGGRQIGWEPDSAAIFMLFELALMSIDQGVTVRSWRTLLPVFVEIQEIYLMRFPLSERTDWALTHYGTPAAPPAPGSAARGEYELALASIERRYEGCSDRRELESRAAANLRRAARIFEMVEEPTR